MDNEKLELQSELSIGTPHGPMSVPPHPQELTDLPSDKPWPKSGQFTAELVKRWNAYPELVGALRELMRLCVTPKGFPDKGKGRTHEQQAAFDEARALLASIEEKP